MEWKLFDNCYNRSLHFFPFCLILRQKSSINTNSSSPTSLGDIKIQFCSDLHLEFGSEGVIKPNAKYLALLGDIGLARQKKYHNFLLAQADRYEKVFVIAGDMGEFHHLL